VLVLEDRGEHGADFFADDLADSFLRRLLVGEPVF